MSISSMVGRVARSFSFDIASVPVGTVMTWIKTFNKTFTKSSISCLCSVAPQVHKSSIMVECVPVLHGVKRLFENIEDDGESTDSFAVGEISLYGCIWENVFSEDVESTTNTVQRVGERRSMYNGDRTSARIKGAKFGASLGF